MKRARGQKRGVALVMVLGAITVLTVFLTDLQQQTSAELSAALAERDSLRAEYYARSAVNLARLLIALEPTVRRTVAPLLAMLGSAPPQIPVWEFSDMVLGPYFNDPKSASGLGLPNVDLATAKNIGLSGGGRFELTIVDEDSKINVNAAARSDPTSELRFGRQLLGLIDSPQYDPLFQGRDADNQFSDRATVCGALVDWADFDEQTFACDPRATGPVATGVEDNFYQTIGLPYRRKNAALDSLEELRLVRGMSDDFWSTFVDPDPDDPHKRILTVWGQGTVNVNTANAQTLWALACGGAPEARLCNDPLQAQAFLMSLSMMKSVIQNAPLFGTPNDFIAFMGGGGMLGPFIFGPLVEPIKFKVPQEVAKTISTESKIFSIYGTGIVPGYRRETRVRVHAVVDFRTAPPIPAGFGGAYVSSTSGSGAPLPATIPTPSMPLSGSTMGPGGLPSVMQPSMAGTIIYFRTE